MDSAQLEAFLSVCTTLNFTKAAEHLHISQSAVTARIKALELDVGKTLFLRDNRNVSLTAAGAAYLPYAERMMRLHEESKVTLSDEFEHRIVLSGPGSVWHYVFLQHIVKFREEHPNVAVKFLSYIDPSYMIRDLLLDGAVHIAIRFDPPEQAKVTRIPLFEDELLLVAAKRRNSPVAARDFYSQAYCHIEWGQPFPDWFKAIAGPGYIPALQTDHSSIMLTLLLQGTGFGFMPRSIVQPYLADGRLVRLPAEFELPVMTAYALYLTEQCDQISVRLGLRLLGIADLAATPLKPASLQANSP
ncbi:LysR family transcriptional regulator [Paenibacillus rhizovicinus]|uniref:LysR family transcriptional regulator n=1 Tax=Paenibacillus rhizovicinus TaxID=2704463 RepID=A0A6C0P8X2_9BACL|nr:LysR family transcriptional regulator [Paenibacillus rhizovicinus]QHW34073.1 LysR family transcriptional regulator [Paenibacillus rhizovicinus]